MQSSNIKQLIFQYPNLVKYGNDHAYFPFNASQLMTHLARARELIFKPGVGRTELQEVPTQLFSGEITDHPDLAGWLLNIVGETIDAAIDGPHQGIRGTERTLQSFLILCEKKVDAIKAQNEGNFDNRTFQQLFSDNRHFETFINFCDRYEASRISEKGYDWTGNKDFKWLSTVINHSIDVNGGVFKKKVTKKIIADKLKVFFNLKSFSDKNFSKTGGLSNQYLEEIKKELIYR